MKIARIILTATILFSLKSTLFCSAAEEFEDLSSLVPAANRELTRVPSFDLLRGDGNLVGQKARVQWMLDNDGNNYSHWGQQREVRPGSDRGAQERYENIGKTEITTVENAVKFFNLCQRNKLNLPEEAMQPSLNLIAKDRARNIAILALPAVQQKAARFQEKEIAITTLEDRLATIAQNNLRQGIISESYANFLDKQQQGHNAACAARAAIQARNEELGRMNQSFMLKIQALSNQKLHKVAELKKIGQEEDAKNAQKIQELVAQALAAKTQHHARFPQQLITDKLFMRPADARELNPASLARVTEKYNFALADAQDKAK